MASQAQLELQIEQLNARIAALQAVSALAEQEGNTRYLKTLQNDIKTAQSELVKAETALANYSTVPNESDPNPNAVITPGTGTNPVANVDITGGTPALTATPAQTVKAQDQANKQVIGVLN